MTEQLCHFRYTAMPQLHGIITTRNSFSNWSKENMGELCFLSVDEEIELLG